MSSHVITEVRQAIKEYLKAYHLPKIAYLTNCLPDEHDKVYLMPYFNYMCFCTSSKVERAEFLFRHSLIQCGKTPFDSVISEPKSCLMLRQYGYVFISVNDSTQAQLLIDFVSNNKNEISCSYPILLRVAWESGMGNFHYRPNCSIKKKLGKSDMILEVK